MTVYPTYKDSGIEWQGQIPAHWDETLFFSVAKLKNQTGYIEEDLLSVYLDTLVSGEKFSDNVLIIKHQ